VDPKGGVLVIGIQHVFSQVHTQKKTYITSKLLLSSLFHTVPLSVLSNHNRYPVTPLPLLSNTMTATL
jgi:hypothetical protein